MSSGEYPEVLDTITAAAEQNKAAIQEAIQSFQAAEGEFDALLGFLSLAGAGAEASGEQVDKDLAAVDSATEHAAQALAIHQAAGFTATNESAMTAQKQIAEGIRLVGKYRRGFAHLQQQTTLGAIADIATPHETINQKGIGSAIGGRVMLELYGRPSQQDIIDATRNYKERRIRESEVVKSAQAELNEAQTALQPADPEVSTEPKPTAESVIADIEDIVGRLGPAGDILQGIPSKLAEIVTLHEEAGRTLMEWQGAPEEVKGAYREMGEVLAQLALPVSPAVVNEYIGELASHKASFETVQIGGNKVTGFIREARNNMGQSIKALTKYLRRRH